MKLGRPHTEWDFILSAQCGVVTHSQARQAGFSAAELQALTDKVNWEVHVTVPRERRPEGKRMRGVVVHRSDQSRCDGVAPWKLPRTQVEDTVLDLIAAASTMDDAYSWLSRALTRRDPVPAWTLREALARRKRFPGRAWLSDALADAGDGAHFPLERRYARDVERAHGLPRAARQVRRTIDGKTHRKDCWYKPYGICVELDGVTYHRGRLHEDRHRDNVNLAVDDLRTFRFDIADLTEGACQSAAMVAASLRRNGWQGKPHPCGRPACIVGKS